MAEELGKKIERFGQDVWKKTTDVVGAIGKSAEVANKKRELKYVYSDIGQKFFETHPAQAADESPDLAERAKTLTAEIADQEAQILEQRGSKKCVSCGEMIPFAAAFCSKCGAAQPKNESEPEPATEAEPTVDAEVIDSWICPVCSATLGSTDAFCTVCGAKRP